MADHYIFKSETQLGDCLLHAHFMRSVVNKINENITFDFHIISTHQDQVREYVNDTPQINLKPYEQAPVNALRGWVGQFGIPKLPCALDGLRLASYQALSEIKMGIESPFKCVDDVLYDHTEIHSYSTKLKSYDVLLVNSPGQSKQMSNFNDDVFIDFVHRLNSRGLTVITTKKVEDVECTQDTGLTVMGIGGLSINCKVVIGIGTGAMQCCLNVWNKEKRFLYIDQNHFFRRKNIHMIHTLNEVLL